MACGCGKRKHLQSTSVQAAQKATNQEPAEVVIVSSAQETPAQPEQNK